ncbi:hypothetical protein POM88_022595 [Heracleum sosnowskyi]|uniref:Vesicle-fusing ATPase n=1 Tax=Heracleum sosnowskyi TaxID=360622 RepID=A0AAD8IFL3_9APIA|nr:hypothetical protein POM88_022595 [Heracleum sosnowskyi]
MASTVGISSDFPYVKIVSAESMIGLSESTKCAQIVKVFEDAYKSPLSIVILDDIERLLEFVAIGPRFSNLISQTLMVLLKRLPPQTHTSIVIAHSLNDMLMKKMYLVLEMAAKGEEGGEAEVVYSGKQTISISHFHECLQDAIRY